MTFANGGTDSLGRLLTCTVLNGDILIRSRPCLLLITSRLKDTFIGEDEMLSILDNLIDLVFQLDGHEGILLVQLILLLRHILGLNFLELIAIELQDLAVMFGLYNSIRKLPMEQLGPFSKTKMSLILHILVIKKIVLLFRFHSS